MYKPGGTIRDALRRIEKGDYVLPAIQREFVWRPEQIARLFDSLMQGYPFGTFLFWRVEPKRSAAYKFYGFVRHYHQKNDPHCPELGLLPNQALTAVLDGQQRLTALNIGLRGSMALKEPNKWWTNPSAFPKRLLFLDLLAAGDPDGEGAAYKLRFLEPAKAAAKADGELWFPVGDILGMASGPQMVGWLTGKGLGGDALNQAYETLDRLHRVVHTEPRVYYYEEENQDLERVLNIFVRLNSGGTVLSYSDLLLSFAVAQWSKLDARREIHTLVDEMNAIGTGFAFSKDFVLKAGLMLADVASVGFKVENFDRENMGKLEADWPKMRRILLLTAQLAASFGFNGQTLRADSALLPIAYYLYNRNAPENYVTHGEHAKDREAIRGWLVRSLLKASGIWGSGLDTLLTALRATLQAEGRAGFPVEALRRTMAQRGRSLAFEPEEVEELLDMEYGDKRLFPLLSLLYPFIDLRNHFHVDHIFPAARFTPQRLRKAGVPEQKVELFRRLHNRLANLQLLAGAFNNEKRQKMPADWLSAHCKDTDERAHYCKLHDLSDLPTEMSSFDAFFEKRRARLKERVALLIDVS